MSLADELLNDLPSNEMSFYTTNPESEEHIVVDNKRYIYVPEALKRIAVQYDHDVETVTFDCPRYWDGLDMSQMTIYINYMLVNKSRGMYLAKNVTIDETDSSIMHFEWTISRNVTSYKGNVSFLICIKKTDSEGNEENHWNSELCSDLYISEGLECTDAIVSIHPDIITDLLTRMEYVETIATPENMQDYVTNYLNTDPTLHQTVENKIDEFLEYYDPTTPDAMQGYVSRYFDEHPPLFVIGPNKPGVKCLWFNTNGDTSITDNTVVKLSADDPNETVYAEVEETQEQVNDFTIV